MLARRHFLQSVGSGATAGFYLEHPLGALAKPPANHPGITETVQPIDFQRNGTFDGILDLYWKNSRIDLAQAKRLGVQAVIYRTSLGLVDQPRERDAYHAAKAKAHELGLLWGAFHVPSSDDLNRQLDAFFKIEDGSDPKTLMVLDWEGTTHGSPDLGHMRALIEAFRDAKGHYPMIYGGNTLRENCGRHRDDVLAECPLWYICILTQKHPVLELPKATWSEYKLWQYATEKRRSGDPYPVNVLEGGDFSRFKGTMDELREAWPFRRT